MANLEHDVVITDGIHDYFRPSMYKMESEIKYEVKDYENQNIKTSLMDSYQSLVLVDHPYDRLCFVRKKIHEMGLKSSNENMTDIMVLLGIQHKLEAQLTQVVEFCSYYQKLIDNIDERLVKPGYRFLRLFKCFTAANKKLIPMLQTKQLHEYKLTKYEKERSNLLSIISFTKGKILFMADENISKLGIIKE